MSGILSSTPATDPKTGLLRAVSRWGIVALALNDVIGSGVYLSNPKEAAELLGAASVWAILAAGVAVLLLVLCFAEAGSLFDTPGSGYVYTRAAFGDFAGFEVGWMTWVARITSVAGLSVGFARVMGFLWEGAKSGWGRTAMIVLPVLALTIINVVGIRSGAQAAVILTWGKILPLVLLVAVGIFFVSWSRIFPVPIPEAHKLGAAALVVLFAYSGFENTPAAPGSRAGPPDVPHALRRDMDANRDRAAARAVGHVSPAGRALRHRAARDLHRHGRGGAGPAPQDAGERAELPASRRPAHSDPRPAHVLRIPLAGDGQAAALGRARARGRSDHLFCAERGRRPRSRSWSANRRITGDNAMPLVRPIVLA